MKKYIVLGAILLAALPGLACDQCGCGGLLLGVQPMDHANNFGLQWRMRYLQGDIMAPAARPLAMPKHGGHADAPAGKSATYLETYTVLEARGQVWVTNRTSISASIPLLNNFKAVDGVRHADLYAVGDPILLARYAVLGSTFIQDTTRLRHRFTVGLGIKVPLGRTDVVQYGEQLDYDLQPSTGTWDPLLSLEYMVRGRNWGTSLRAMGRYNGVMDDGRRMGHSANFLAEVFRILRLKQLRLLPSAGGYLECAMPDEMHGEADHTTGGNVLFSNMGVRLWWNQLGLALAWQHALINDQGAMMIPNRERVTVGASWYFGKTEPLSQGL